MPRFTLIGLALALACGDKDGPVDSAPDPVAPAEGHWSILGEETVVLDTCGFLDQGDTGDTGEDPPGGFTLTLSTATTFTIDQDDEDGESYSCALDLASAAFTCAPEERRDDVGGASLDAVVAFTQTVAGVFTADTAADIGVDLVAVCEGADCATVEGALSVSFPCEARLEFSATADE